MSGSPDRGLPLVEKSLALSPRPPATYYAAKALDSLRAGRADDALTSALRIDAPNWFMAPLIVAAVAGRAGRPDVADRAVMHLLELYPAFPSHAREELAKWQLDALLRAQVELGLRAAGLEIG